ncbi:hypothetical protein EDL96_12785 [Kocuria soli]|uniref:Uncharacterized protein n=1 Tax=Kocuria soli TaxID=2485125 RepID=A0A3N3ZM10_9MICC|nr:hypothetical protein [Kocuria soli]ROZ61626.1 hypothetical protein EDL96_12785 [Kocuria soli]
MQTAFALVMFTLAFAVLVLVLGVQVLAGAIRFTVWVVSTKAGWITAGLGVLVYLFLTVGW